MYKKIQRRLVLALGFLLAVIELFNHFKYEIFKEKIDNNLLAELLSDLNYKELDYKNYKAYLDCNKNLTLLTVVEITKEEVEAENTKRKNNFKVDPRFKECQVHPDLYKNTGYDKGHMVSNDTINFTEQGMQESFFMSNMVPQSPSLNRGVWKKIEEQARDLALNKGIVTEISGGIYDSIFEIKDGLYSFKEMYKILIIDKNIYKIYLFENDNDANYKEISLAKLRNLI